MEEKENVQEKNEFYTVAANYWDHIPPTVDGMLGGFGFISQTDIKGSTVFLKALFESKNPPSKTSALDCGSGIGRITKNLLLNHFKHVDLVEQNSKFLEAAKTNLKNYSSRVDYYPIEVRCHLVSMGFGSLKRRRFSTISQKMFVRFEA